MNYPKVLIEVKGGMVISVITNTGKVSVKLCDHDNNDDGFWEYLPDEIKTDEEIAKYEAKMEEEIGEDFGKEQNELIQEYNEEKHSLTDLQGSDLYTLDESEIEDFEKWCSRHK